jgi:micrococcal nuclease
MNYINWLGWLFIPFFMILLRWKKLGMPTRILASIWSAIILLAIFTNGDSSSPIPVAHEQQTAVEEVVPKYSDDTKLKPGSEDVNKAVQVSKGVGDLEKGDKSEAAVENNRIPAKVLRVVDGDTMQVMFHGKEETIRLLLVDTPETKHPSKPVQPYGPQASDFAIKTLTGQNVDLEIDVSERDKYGRILVYLWINGKIFNEMLLEEGLARVAYVIPPNIKYVDRFREIEKKAQLAGIGIWSIEDYTREDGFYHAVEPSYAKDQQEKSTEAAPSSQSCSNPKIKGNINSKGEKIYHVPGGQFYDRTKAEELYCTEEEAVEAGFRKSQK